MAAPRSRTRSPKPRKNKVEGYLRDFAQRLGETKAARKGSIALRLTGAGGGEYFLDCSKGSVRLAKGMPRTAPLIEVMGDAKRIQAILAGKKEGRTQFLAGGIRVRGDLRYLSDVALELGIIKEPL